MSVLTIVFGIILPLCITAVLLVTLVLMDTIK